MGLDLPGTDGVNSLPSMFRERSSRGSVRWRSFRQYSFRRSSVEGTGPYKKRRWSLILVSFLNCPIVQSRLLQSITTSMWETSFCGGRFLLGLAAHKCSVLVSTQYSVASEPIILMQHCQLGTW